MLGATPRKISERLVYVTICREIFFLKKGLVTFSNKLPLLKGSFACRLLHFLERPVLKEKTSTFGAGHKTG